MLLKLEKISSSDLLFLIKQYKLENISFIKEIIYKTEYNSIKYYVIKYSESSYNLFNLNSNFFLNYEKDAEFNYHSNSSKPELVFITDNVLELLVYLSKYKNLLKNTFRIRSTININKKFLETTKENLAPLTTINVYFSDTRFKQIFTIKTIFVFNDRNLDILFDGNQYIVSSKSDIRRKALSFKYDSLNYVQIRKDFQCKKIIKILS